MVEQLWYTWSPVGLSKIKGFQVRAASEGLSDLQSQGFKEMDPQLRYYLPTGTDPYAATTTTSPSTLSFIKISGRNIIVHKVYLGNSDGSRPGNYFCHALANLPPNFMACDAIKLWKSPFWQNSDASLPESSLALPSINDFVLYKEKGPLDHADLQEVQKFLPSVIEAFLLLKFDERLYIYAPDKIVAALIWGLAHSITQAMQPRLTFSTYEQNVDKENVARTDIRVVGSCRAPDSPDDQGGYASTSRQQDLPESCYSGGRGYAINCYTGKHSQLPERGLEAVYAQFATQRLIDANMHATLAGKLEKLKGIEDKDSFLAFFKLRNLDDALFVRLLEQHGHSTKLSKQEITALLNDYEQAIMLLEERGIQDAIIELVSEDESWWNDFGVPAFEKLADPRNAHFRTSAAEALHVFAMQVIPALCKHAFHQDWAVFRRLIQLLTKITPLKTDPNVWIHLHSALTEPSLTDPSYHPGNIFRWDWHLWLLTAWQQVANRIPGESIQRWLEINWEELEELLKNVTLPQWRVVAIKTLLEYSLPIPAQIATLVSSYYEPFQAASELLMQSPAGQIVAIDFFRQMAQYRCQKKLDLLLTLLNYQIEDQQHVEVLLSAANLTLPELNMVFENKTWQLLPYLAFSPSVQNMVELYLGNFTLEQLDASGRQVLRLLQSARQQFPARLGKVATALDNWMLASEGFQPKGSEYRLLHIEEQYLIAMRNAIMALRLAGPQYRDRFFLVIINTQLTHEQLDLVIRSFAPVFTRNHSRKELLSELGMLLGSKYKSNEHNPKLWMYLLPYITVALAYAHELHGSAKDKFVDKVLRSGILQHNDKETFEHIHRQSARWPVEIRAEWNHYANWLRPTSFSEKVQAVGKGVVGGVTGIFASRSPQPPQRSRNAEEQFGILPSIDQRKPVGGTSDGSPSSSTITPPAAPTQNQYVHQPTVPITRSVTQPDQNYRVRQQPVYSPEWIEKVRQVKNIYYVIKISQIQMQISPRKNNKENEQLLKQKTDLEYQCELDVAQQRKNIRYELEAYIGIQESFANISKKNQKALEAKINEIFNVIDRTPGYHTQLHGITDDEIREILTIYIRRETVQ